MALIHLTSVQWLMQGSQQMNFNNMLYIHGSVKQLLRFFQTKMGVFKMSGLDLTRLYGSTHL